MASRPTPLYIIGRIIKLLGLLLLTFIIGLLFWRVYISTILPRENKRLAVNDSLVAAYKSHGDELEMFRQSVPDISREEHNYGYFSVVDYIIIPEASQVQLIFRYNHSTIEKLAEDFGLPGVPGRETELFELSLVKTIASSDNSGGRMPAASGDKRAAIPRVKIINRTTLLYNYRGWSLRGKHQYMDRLSLKSITSDGLTITNPLGQFEPTTARTKNRNKPRRHR